MLLPKSQTLTGIRAHASERDFGEGLGFLGFLKPNKVDTMPRLPCFGVFGVFK